MDHLYCELYTGMRHVLSVICITHVMIIVCTPYDTYNTYTTYTVYTSYVVLCVLIISCVHDTRNSTDIICLLWDSCVCYVYYAYGVHYMGNVWCGCYVDYVHNAHYVCLTLTCTYVSWTYTHRVICDKSCTSVHWYAPDATYRAPHRTTLRGAVSQRVLLYILDINHMELHLLLEETLNVIGFLNEGFHRK